MTVLVVWSFCPIFTRPSFAIPYYLTNASATSCAVPVLASVRSSTYVRTCPGLLPAPECAPCERAE
eukprot:9979636-Heterocapsa_arctica.AAC.1